MGLYEHKEIKVCERAYFVSLFTYLTLQSIEKERNRVNRNVSREGVRSSDNKAFGQSGRE